MLSFLVRSGRRPSKRMHVDRSIEWEMLVLKMASALDVVTDTLVVRRVEAGGPGRYIIRVGDIREGDHLSLDEDDDEDEDLVSAFSTPERRKKKEVPPPPLEVRLDSKDVPARPGHLGTEGLDFGTEATLAGAGCPLETKARIVKALNTAASKASYENEARTALALAQKLMVKYNLTLVELMAEQGGSLKETEELKGGMVKAELWRRGARRGSFDASPATKIDRWIYNFASCCSDNFDVAHFKERGDDDDPMIVVFYGVYANCQLAAYAYKVNAERISSMVQAYEPPPNNDYSNSNKRRKTGTPHSDDDSDGDSRRRSSAYTRTARQSYARGIVSGLDEAVRKNKKTRDKNSQESSTALTLYEHSKQVQDDVLKEHGLRILEPRRYSSSATFNHAAFNEGLRDSEDIDLGQQAIRAKPSRHDHAALAKRHKK